MRETLSQYIVLLRYGWRSALGAYLSKMQSTALRMFALFGVIYWPILYYHNSYRALQTLSDSERLSFKIKEWNLPTEAFSGPSELWPAVPHLIGLGLCIMMLVVFLSGMFAAFLVSQRKGYETEMEWLQTFPVRLRSLLWGRLLQSSLIQPYLGFLILPFLYSFVIIRAHNLVFSLVTSTLLGWLGMLAASSVGMILHWFSSFRLTAARQRDFRFLMVLLLMGAIFLIYFPFMMHEAVYWRTVLRFAPSLADSVLLPFTTRLLSGDASSLIPLFSVAGAVLVLAQASVLISEKIVNQGPAAQEQANKKEQRFLTGLLDVLNPVVRRELRILLRDRSQWATIISGPLFALGFMIWTTYGDQSLSQGKSFLSLCLLMYVMMSGLVFQALYLRERPSLWFYASLPMRLSDVLRQQMKVPCVLFGSIYALAFVAFAPRAFWQDADSMSRLALGLAFAFAANRFLRSVALSSYTPAHENTVGKPLLLMSWFAPLPALTFIVIEAQPWTVAAILFPFMILASVYEKKVLALEDDLIDPTYRITPRADLAQGLTAALLYTFGLIVTNTIARFFDINLSIQFLLAAFTLLNLHYYFSTREVQDVPTTFGRVRFLDLLFLGFMAAFILRAAGFWDRLTHGSAFLEHIYDLSDYPATPIAFVMFFIILARSVAEELIFRGLIQRGLSSRMAFPLALLASAGLTTLSHKPQDFGPVFLTALGSGILYYRTRLLWPGILLAIAVQGLRLFGF